MINRPSCHPVRYQPTIVFPLLLPRRCQLHALRTMQFPWAETMSVIIDKVPMGYTKIYRCSYAKTHVYPVYRSFLIHLSMNDKKLKRTATSTNIIAQCSFADCFWDCNLSFYPASSCPFRCSCCSCSVYWKML